MQVTLTPEVILGAYAQGIFPMAERADGPHVHWYYPEKRGQLPIDGLHISRSLKKVVLREDFQVKINSAFPAVISACARRNDKRQESWINTPIQKVFCTLHALGYAHSVECWQEDLLVGGLYGLSIGGAFFGESMFSIVSDASKVALVHLVARLSVAGYVLLDTQFLNAHLMRFGAYELAHDVYMERLRAAIEVETDFILPDMTEAQIVRQYLSAR